MRIHDPAGRPPRLHIAQIILPILNCDPDSTDAAAPPKTLDRRSAPAGCTPPAQSRLSPRASAVTSTLPTAWWAAGQGHLEAGVAALDALAGADRHLQVMCRHLIGGPGHHAEHGGSVAVRWSPAPRPAYRGDAEDSSTQRRAGAPAGWRPPRPGLRLPGVLAMRPMGCAIWAYSPPAGSS